jgi:iron complex outermembrane receptor protein
MSSTYPARPRAACTVCLSLAAAALSLARTAAADAPAAAADPGVLEEIIVTAEKRTEDAIRTPIALAVYGSNELKEAQVVSVAELQNIDPSINVAKTGFGDTVTIRGVTSVDTTSKGTPGIAFNIDGIPINRGYEQAEAFFDLERVEVLKGPQGTLYGASSTGGALSVITAKPANQFMASTDITVGDFNTRRTTAVVNVPFTDAVAVRAAVNYNYHDGYEVTSDGTPYTNGENDVTGRLSGLVKFNSDMTLLVQETLGNIGGPGAGGVNYDTLTGSPTGAAQRVVYASAFPQLLDDTFSNLSAQFNWGIGPVHLTYVGGYLNYSANEHSASTDNPLANDSPSNNGPFPFFSTPEYLWRDYRGHFLTNSQELRLSNEQPGQVEWVVGANWFRENIHESDHNWTATDPAPDALPVVADSVNGIDPVNQTIHTAKGVFGQATWHATSRIDLTVGLRETDDALVRHGTFVAGPAPGCVAPEDCIGGPNNGSEDDRKLTYRANVAYHFTPTEMAYATVSTGFKGGGFNDFCGSGPCPYGPEELTAYELGYKGRPLDNFEFSSDLFYYDYSERQISQLNNVNGSLVIFTSLFPAVIEGWENEFTFRPTRADELHLSVTALRSHYESLETYLPATVGPIGAPVNLAGRSLDATPAAAATFGYSHTFALPQGASVRLHADLKYSSSYYETSIGPFVSYTQPSYTRSNFDLRYTAPDGKFYLGGFVRNIENKMQITGAPTNAGTAYPPGVTGVLPVGVTDPRTWGLTSGVRW